MGPPSLPRLATVPSLGEFSSIHHIARMSVVLLEHRCARFHIPVGDLLTDACLMLEGHVGVSQRTDTAVALLLRVRRRQQRGARILEASNRLTIGASEHVIDAARSRLSAFLVSASERPCSPVAPPGVNLREGSRLGAE